jgi:hypothetical protein
MHLSPVTRHSPGTPAPPPQMSAAELLPTRSLAVLTATSDDTRALTVALVAMVFATAGTSVVATSYVNNVLGFGARELSEFRLVGQVAGIIVQVRARARGVFSVALFDLAAL